MRRLFAALWLLLPAVLAASPAAATPQLVEYGIYSGTTNNCHGGGPILQCMLSDVSHLARVSDVPGTLGVTFGIQYTLDSYPAPVRVTVIFPPPGLHNPRFPAAVPTYSNDEICQGQVCMDSYSFDFPWEIVPGYWTIQIWEGGKPVLQKRFRVYLPDKTKPKEGRGRLTASL